MKIALVHDYLREYGGAERVVEVLHEMWPDAPLYTAFTDWKSMGKHADRFRTWDIRTSWVERHGFIKKFISPLRFLTPWIWPTFDFSGYDLVISSSGWFISRGIVVHKPTVHICYIHHPPRNLYGYATGSNLERYWFVRVYATFVNFFLRQYDFRTAQTVDYFIANSKETARRVQKFYRRESTVIYPPIDVKIKDQRSKIKSARGRGRDQGSYYLCVGRLSWMKRIDLAIEACNARKLPLKIVGVGHEEAALRRLAGPTIEFVGGVSDEKLDALYNGAKALIFCALDEDFGMVPVEAMAHGVPVIALRQGGVTETVIDGKTGVFFDRPDAEDLVKAIERFERFPQKHDWLKACRQQAQRFSKEEFKQRIQMFIKKKYKNAVV